MEVVPDCFDVLSIKDVLDADSRPTFVIDLDPDLPTSSSNSAIDPIFCNAALRSHERLLDSVLGGSVSGNNANPRNEAEDSCNGGDRHLAKCESPAVAHDQFQAWATGVTKHDDSKDVFPLSFHFQNLLWTGSTVRKRWRLISGNRLWKTEDQLPLDLSCGAPLEVATGGVGVRASLPSKKTLSRKAPSRHSRTPMLPTVNAESDADAVSLDSDAVMGEDDVHLSPIFYPRPSVSGGSIKTGMSKPSRNISVQLNNSSERNAIDWTAPEPEGHLSIHLQYARSVDWSATSLGPMEQWSSEFRQIANLVMANPFPAALFWGPRLVSTLTNRSS